MGRKSIWPPKVENKKGAVVVRIKVAPGRYVMRSFGEYGSEEEKVCVADSRIRNGRQNLPVETNQEHPPGRTGCRIGFTSTAVGHKVHFDRRRMDL